MSEQASLHLCNLASIHGLAKAREMLGIPSPDAKPSKPSKPAQVTPPAPAVEVPSAPAAESSPAPVASNPPDFVAPNAAAAVGAAEDPAKAQRTAEDEGAKVATAAQLKAALAQLGIEFKPNAKKADLLALFLARP